MQTNKDKLILEAYQNMHQPKQNKYQTISEEYWDGVYNAHTILTEDRNNQYAILEEKIYWQAMCLTEAELPEFFRVLEEGWKDKLKAIGGGIKKAVKKGAEFANNQAKDENSAFNKMGKGINKVTGKVATGLAKGAIKTGKALGKAGAAFAKEVIPDDWQKKGKEIIDKVKNKLMNVYEKKIKPMAQDFGNKIKAAGNVLIPPEVAESIINNAKNNSTIKKIMSKMGGDSEKSIGNYLTQVLKDNKGSLIAAVAALAFPPSSMWVGGKIAATVLIPIIMDGIIAYQKFKEDSVKAAMQMGAKSVGDYQTMKKEGKLKKIQPPKELGIGQPDMLTA